MQVLFLVGQMSKHHLCTEGNAQKIQVAWVEVVQNVFNYEKNFSPMLPSLPSIISSTRNPVHCEDVAIISGHLMLLSCISPILNILNLSLKFHKKNCLTVQ